MGLDPRLLTVLVCPVDKGKLFDLGDDRGLYNPRLRRLYVVRDGIPVMLPDESIEVSEAEAAEIDVRIASGELRSTG
ncbi:MAG: Trm112 family protein [Ilumatobacteraceae bacterium]